MASRPPTDRSAEAVARAFLAAHRAYAMNETALTKLLRARDAAWRRVVRKAFADELAVLWRNHNAQELLPHMLKLVLATAPGARGTKGGRRG